MRMKTYPEQFLFQSIFLKFIIFGRVDAIYGQFRTFWWFCVKCMTSSVKCMTSATIKTAKSNGRKVSRPQIEIGIHFNQYRKKKITSFSYTRRQSIKFQILFILKLNGKYSCSMTYKIMFVVVKYNGSRCVLANNLSHCSL